MVLGVIGIAQKFLYCWQDNGFATVGVACGFHLSVADEVYFIYMLRRFVCEQWLIVLAEFLPPHMFSAFVL